MTTQPSWQTGATSKHEIDRRNAANHRNVAADVLALLARDPKPRVRQAVAAQKRTPSEILVALASDAAGDVRKEVAENPRAPGDALHLLVTDRNVRTRTSVALHKNTARNTLQILAKDANAKVRKLALGHPTLVPALDFSRLGIASVPGAHPPADESETFWKPRGDIFHVIDRGNELELSIRLAPGAWPLTRFNAAPFVALQCLVALWSEAELAVARTRDAKDSTLAACLSHRARKRELAFLRALTDERTFANWHVFNAAAAHYIASATITRAHEYGADGYRMTIVLANPELAKHAKLVNAACLG